MTATVNDVLKVAEAEVGYVEGGGAGGHSGNITKFWAELDPALQGQPWCAAFQRWVDRHAKAPDLPVSNPYYCPNLVTYARQHGLWDTSGKYSPGDMVFFDFTGQGIAEHIGRVRSDDGHVIHTVEGNTESGSAGDQANGGGVYNKDRPHGTSVLGVLAYHKLLDASTVHHAGGQVHPPRNKVKHNPNPEPSKLLKQGDHGDGVKWVQWAVGVPVDGTFGPKTKHAVEQFQKYHKACGTADGIIGPKTRAVLARVTN